MLKYIWFPWAFFYHLYAFVPIYFIHKLDLIFQNPTQDIFQSQLLPHFLNCIILSAYALIILLLTPCHYFTKLMIQQLTLCLNFIATQ